MLLSIIVICLSFCVAFAQSAQTGESQDIASGDSQIQAPQGIGGGPQGTAEVRYASYCGYAVESEGVFEMAGVFFTPPEQAIVDGWIKTPAGTIEIGARKYFINEAKMQTEEAQLQQGQKDQKSKAPSCLIVKSCTARVSATYGEIAIGMPPQVKDVKNQRIPQGVAEFIGDIKLIGEEKDAGDKKVKVLHGQCSVGEKKYYLYLEAKMDSSLNAGPGMPPRPPKMRGQGGSEPQPSSQEGSNE